MAKIGRPKGSPNKATATAREAIARLVDYGAPRMLRWLDEIEKIEGPAVAWRCMTDVIEYHIPKLQRTEHTGENGGPVQHGITLNVVGVPAASDGGDGNNGQST